MYLLFIVLAIAFGIVMIGKIIAARLDKDARPNQSRGARATDTLTTLLAALIILGGIVVLQGFPLLNASGSSGRVNCVPGSITIDGSSALAPLVQKVAADYERKCPGASITVQANGSETGKTELEAGTIQIGDSDTFIAKDQSELIDHTVAVVVFAMILNPDVTGVSTLTIKQIQDIYTNKITNWREVGGPNLSIHPISRDTNSGTLSTFEDYILNVNCAVQTCQPPPVQEPSGSAVVNAVQTTAGAIGYVDLGTALSFHITPIAINGFSANGIYVKNNRYTFWNFEHMYTERIPAYNSLTEAFIDYMYSDDAAQEMGSLSYLKFNDILPCALNQHNNRSLPACP